MSIIKQAVESRARNPAGTILQIAGIVIGAAFLFVAPAIAQAACPAFSGTLPWGAGCSAYVSVPVTSSGTYVTKYNTAAGYTSTNSPASYIKYRCNNTTWTLSASSCNKTTCSGTTQYWSSCSGSLPTTNTGSSGTAKNSKSGYSGSATYACNVNGTSSGSWAKSPSSQSCSANSYTYYFNGNGATTNPSPTSRTLSYGASLSPPKNPSRTGYTFSGWSPSIPSTMPLNGGTSYAQWSANSYTYYFNGNGATTNPSPTSRTLSYGASLSPPSNPSRTGYTFTGWSPSIPSTMPLNGGTSYAQWSVNVAPVSSVTITNAGGTPTNTFNVVVGNSLTIKWYQTGGTGTITYTLYDGGTPYPWGSGTSWTDSPSIAGTFYAYVRGCSSAGCANSPNITINVSCPAGYTNIGGTCYLNTYPFSVSKTGTGSGTVTGTPTPSQTNINCGSTCSATYSHGTSITLSASPTTGSTFTGWSGAGCSGTGNCSLSMTSTKSVTANFAGAAPTTASVTVSPRYVAYSGSITVTSSGSNSPTYYNVRITRKSDGTVYSFPNVTATMSGRPVDVPINPGSWAADYDVTSQACNSGGCSSSWSSSVPLTIGPDNPVGGLDSVTSTSATGWACDASDYTQPVTVHFYDGPSSGGNAAYLGQMISNTVSRADAAGQCGGYGGTSPNLRGYSYTFTDANKDKICDNTPHTIYAYGINNGTGSTNPELSTPRTITCSPTGKTVTASWYKVEGATYYKVYADKGADGTSTDCVNTNGDQCFPNVPATPDATQTKTFTGVSGATYRISVRACNTHGCSSPTVTNTPHISCAQDTCTWGGEIWWDNSGGWVDGKCKSSYTGTVAVGSASITKTNNSALSPGYTGSITFSCTASGWVGSNPSCAGICTNLPSNATAYGGNDSTGLTTTTAYTYSATDTATKCQYTCQSGYVPSGNSCIAAVCTNLPSNATAYGGNDSTGLTTTTAYTYSATDTATKCQYTCQSGAAGYYCIGNNRYQRKTDCTEQFVEACPANYTCSDGVCLAPPPIEAVSSGTLSGHLQAIPSLVRSGNTTQIHWSMENAALCSVTGSNGDGTPGKTGRWTGASSGEGGKESSRIYGQTTYMLRCDPRAGDPSGPLTEIVTVNIIPIFEEL